MAPKTIQLGANVPLNARAGSIPQMQGALQGWYQPMTFIQIGKFLDTGFVSEIGTPTNFRGVMMPYKPRQLDLKRQGQRQWKWWALFCTPELQLGIDDAVKYLEGQFRCYSSEDWRIEGFMKYVLIEDYKGTIANVVYSTDGHIVDDGNQTGPANVVTE
jgi:hypothetical protein